MPGFDGTGPGGGGPMTGGGRGYCSPASGEYMPSYGRGLGGGRGVWGGVGPGFGRGRGYGRGFGRRRPYFVRGGGYAPGYGGFDPVSPGYAAPYSMEPKEEIDMLKAQAESMRVALDEINKRIEALTTKASK